MKRLFTNIEEEIKLTIPNIDVDGPCCICNKEANHKHLDDGFKLL